MIYGIITYIMKLPPNLQRRKKRLWNELRRYEDFLRGTVVLLKRRCTYPRCTACQEGEGHPTWYLSRKVKGKTRLTYLSKEKLEVARCGTEQYARLRALLEEIAEVNAEGLKASTGRRSSGSSRRPSGKKSS